MTQSYFPFNSEMVDGVPDRPGNAESLAAYLAAFFTNGILPNVNNALKVSISSGMKVSVAPGSCVIDGHVFQNESAISLELNAANSSMNRIDRVVVRLDLNRRLMEVGVLTGTPAANPAAPSLTRDAAVYEMCLAQIMVTQGESSLADSNVTDTRGDSTLCGLSGMTAHQDIKVVDLSPFGWQLKWDNDNGVSGTEMAYNNSRFITGLNLVIIDLRVKLNQIPYKENTFHEIAWVPKEIRPKYLRALTAINNSVNNERVYQACVDTNGVIGMHLTYPITAKSYVSIQGAYILE